MKQITAFAILVLTIGFVVSPALTDPFSGFRADQLPNPQINPPVQPAGYAFAIWGLIYAWLLISAVFGVWKRAGDDAWHRARLPLAVSLAVGVPWLAIANASAIWATFTIIVMAIGAVLALWMAPRDDRWWFQAPVGIYAGWLTAASFVSIGSTMAGYGVLFDAYVWAFVCIGGALVVASLVFLARPNAPEYLGTVIWALVGIVVANGIVLPWVSAVAAIGILALLTLAVKRTTMLPVS